MNGQVFVLVLEWVTFSTTKGRHPVGPWSCHPVSSSVNINVNINRIFTYKVSGVHQDLGMLDPHTPLSVDVHPGYTSTDSSTHWTVTVLPRVSSIK